MEIAYRNRIEYLILILEIVESMQMMHRNEHHMYSSFDTHDLITKFIQSREKSPPDLRDNRIDPIFGHAHLRSYHH